MKPEFEYVYVNQDGSVREVASSERDYLTQNFGPCDGGRPYIKPSYESQDGWGSISGFIPRRKIPPEVIVQPVNPLYARSTTSETTASMANAGYEVIRRIVLDQQRQREQLATHPDYLEYEISEQLGTGQPATRSVDKPEGGNKPQPEAEGRSR